MDWISIEENDVKNLKRGDKIKVRSFPYSQKYLDMIDYDYYFPYNPSGILISSSGLRYNFSTVSSFLSDFIPKIFVSYWCILSLLRFGVLIILKNPLKSSNSFESNTNKTIYR